MGIYILSKISKIVHVDSRDICGNDRLIVMAEGLKAGDVVGK